MDYAESLKEHSDGNTDGWLYATHNSLEFWNDEAAKRALTQAEKNHVIAEAKRKQILIAEVRRRGREVAALYLPPEERPKRRLP